MVNVARTGNRPVSFNRNFKTPEMQAIEQVNINLQQRLTSCQDDKRLKEGEGGEGQETCSQAADIASGVLSATLSVSPDEVCIAELANGERTVFLSSRPQIATTKPQEDSGPTCIQSFALNGVERFFYRVVLFRKTHELS
jgi:hypothetical protein